ncbi:hypothetical protein OFN47_29345, partial [Escherichia coli]|nr:hypothetical protein [Escherichia coli]
LGGRWSLAPVAGLAAALGFWTFVYNLGRTLAQVTDPDPTERHFAVALGWCLLVTALGPLLALDLASGVLPLAGLDHLALRRTHATMAV